MDVGTAVVGTGVIVAAGRWAEDKKIEIPQFVGIGVLAIGLAFLQSVNAEFTGKFATLVFAAALMYYMIPISKKFGWSK